MPLTPRTTEVLSLALRLHLMFSETPGYAGLSEAEQLQFCIAEAISELDSDTDLE